MRSSTKYVALDVHQSTTVASLREAGGRVLARSVLPTEEAAILEFFAGMRGTVHIAFEEGTQAQWLHELVAPGADRVVVCDRRGHKRTSNKGDYNDADELSELPPAGPHDLGLEPKPQPHPQGRFQGGGNGCLRQNWTAADLYLGMITRGMREEMARLTLARKFAALILRLWKRGERYDPRKLTKQVDERPDLRGDGVGGAPRRKLQDPGPGYEGQSRSRRSPGRQLNRDTHLTPGPLGEPEQASGRLRAESQIEPWFPTCDPAACKESHRTWSQYEESHAEEDCVPRPKSTEYLAEQTAGADCNRQESQAIRDGSVRP